MFFKENPEKTKHRRDIRAKRSEIRELKKLHGKWINAFMQEHNPAMATCEILVIRTQAARIAEAENVLLLMQKHYKLL